MSSLPTYGRLKDMTKRQVQAMIQALIRRGYLRQEGLRYPVLAVTDEGREIMHDRAKARLGAWEPPKKKEKRSRRPSFPAATGGESMDPLPATAGDDVAELREALRSWRIGKSRELGMPPYTLFWDRTLDELCARRPATLEDLRTIWGMGDQKCRKFGTEIIALITSLAS